MKRVTQEEIVRELIDSSDKSARKLSAEIGKNDRYISNATSKKTPSIGRVALIADAYGYDVALVNRETGEVDYAIEPPK